MSAGPFGPYAARPEPDFHCPACGWMAKFAFSGQAWCGNDDCAVVCWDPTKSIEELLEDVLQISLDVDQDDDGA